MTLHRSLLALALVAMPLFSEAKAIPRRDPLDGALSATLIVIVRQQSPGLLVVEESFYGDAERGQLLKVPNFQLRVEDETAGIGGDERIEPITKNTRILVFLKPLSKLDETWQVDAFGNLDIEVGRRRT